MAEGTFGTAVNCMDGRVQLPIINWMVDKYHLDYVDMITEPGPDKILAERDAEGTASIKRRVEISVTKHGSRLVVLVSHGDCAGNPVPEEVHLGQLRKAMELVRSWDLPVTIVGVWLDDKTWQPEIVAVISP